MPVVHKYVDKDGFYILAVPYGLSSPVTYQVRDGAANMFTEMKLSDGDRISWSFIRPLLAVNQIYTQQSGVTDSEELANALSNLDEREKSEAINHFERYCELTGTELDELRDFANGSKKELTPETREELNSQLSGNVTANVTDGPAVDQEGLTSHISNEEELKKYIIELLDISESNIEKLDYLLNGDLIKITPGLGGELEEKLIQSDDMSKKEVRRASLADMVESVVIDEFNEQDVLKLSLRGVPGSFGDVGHANYEYYGGNHRLFNLSEPQAQQAKRVLKEWGVDSIEQEEFTNGIWLTFELLNNPHLKDVEKVVENIIRVLNKVHEADLTDINRAHLTTLSGILAEDTTEHILKPGWDDRTLNF